LFLTPEHILKLLKVYVTNSNLPHFSLQQKVLNTTFLETHNFYAFFGIKRNKSAFSAEKSNNGCDFNSSLIKDEGTNFRQ